MKTKEEIEQSFESQNLDDLIAMKKRMYSNMNISSAMSDEEKILNKVIANKFSVINAKIAERRKNKLKVN